MPDENNDKTKKDEKNERKKPTFEESLKELEKITQQIESGEIGLEESIAKYEQGMKLVARCRTILNKAEQRIQTLAPTPSTDSNTSSSEARGTT